MNKLGVVIMVIALGSVSLAKSGACQEDYIPAHTEEQLNAVKEWAAGAAFSVHAKNAGYKFDIKAYKADNPNQELFNFGRVNGVDCFDYYVFVTDAATSYFYALDKLYSKIKEGGYEAEQAYFKFYDEHAQRMGMTQYLTPIEEDKPVLMLSSLEISS